LAARKLEILWKGELIKESEVKDLCNKAREILCEESNVQRVDAPVTVCTPSWPGKAVQVREARRSLELANP
jgi:hypothetical protein